MNNSRQKLFSALAKIFLAGSIRKILDNPIEVHLDYSI
jgi:hypothetical protein